ncbi:uncharacterized protein PFL1_06133 [Pseudozyma flocculosa PF-1]|uniref:phosphoribosylglycinamide formyltransferase 1 n=1 Tax=Pseudozyma flocculosa PF-1 TaxID=1277687 RepID=A0A061H130_9BASI|nr:uncharacterized protein PFL1_06133 [Pseudozyma flocculosa PF-1]EPQ26197.1 hypothetical protein PFL1_06133 [Pseudozyma flocculosa PF-1]
MNPLSRHTTDTDPNTNTHTGTAKTTTSSANRPFPSDPASPPTSELASWVNQVRQRNQSFTSSHHHNTTSSASPIRAAGGAASATSAAAAASPISSASELEQDFHRQRQERQSRRNRLSTSGVRGITDSPLSSPVSEFPPASPARSLAGAHGTMIGAPPAHQQGMASAAAERDKPPSSSSSIGSPNLGSPHVRRANSLLSRYGGQYGPTGVAAGPKSASDSPVSLANFMGGKASGPRLGKLAGDGKSAPPEASEIHESRWVALPGLASGGGGDHRDDVAAPPSPSIGLSTSPRKAYMDLIERQNADSAASAIQRPPSPSKPWERPTTTAASPDEVMRPRSPFKPASAMAPPSPAKATSSAVQIPAASSRLSAAGDGSHTSPRKDAATSPLKPEDVPFAKTVTASPALGSGRTAGLTNRASTYPAAATSGAFPPSPPLPQESQRSSTFSATPPLSPSPSGGVVDRNPTASLTRLSAKKMVGQRIREAQERDVLAQRETEAASPAASPAVGVGAGLSKYGGSAHGSSGVRDRWPAGASGAGSNASTPSILDERKKQLGGSGSGGGWSPSKFGNALPGLAGRSPPKSSAAAATSGLGSSPSKRYAEDEADSRAAPVRLPGLGGETSPFKRFSAAASSPTKEERIDSAASEGSVLEPLTKGRVRGPQRRPAAAAAATGSASSTASSARAAIKVVPPASGSGAGASAFAVPSSPRKVTSGFDAPSSPSKTQALASKFGGSTTSAAAVPSSPIKTSFAPASGGPRSPTKTTIFGSSVAAASTDRKATESAAPAPAPAAAAAATAAAPTKPPRSTRGKRVHVLISGSGSNLQSLIDATLLNPPPGIPVIPDAQISFVLSNRKAAYGLTRASESNPPIPTKVLALKTWQNRNPGGTREEYDRVLARAVLDGPADEGKGTPPDLIVLAGFMHIVSEGFLHALGHKTSLPSSTPTIGVRPSKAVPIINLHPALPGAFDGANAIPRAFEAYQQGLTDRTGCMVHEVVADVDRGRPLIVREIVIQKGWDLAKLEDEIHKVEHVIIVEGARQVLEGRLEELDREQEAREQEQQRHQQRQRESDERLTRQRSAAQGPTQRVPSPQKAAPRAPVNLDEVVHVKTAEDAANVAFRAEQALKTSSFEPGAILEYGAPTPSTAASQQKPKTVSIDVISIGADGSTKAVEPAAGASSSDQRVSPLETLYDDETLAVVHRFKASSGLMENRVWVRLGLRSPLHPAQQAAAASDSGDEVLHRAEELAKRYGTKPTFVPAGFEGVDLVDGIGGRWAVARQGSRARFDSNGTALYRVRAAAAAPAGADQTTVTQVDLATSNLCSGDSFVAAILGNSLVWHGRGSERKTREAARRFAEALEVEATGKCGGRIAENKEGREDGFFWDLFDRSQAYASAWYHGLARSVSARGWRGAVQLFDLGLERGTLTLHPAIEPDCLGQMDLLSAQRQDEVSLLNLSNRELFVVVGRRARDQRVKILAGCMLADRLAEHLESQPGNEAGRPAAHVVVLPSRVPREIRAAARYWCQTGDELDGDGDGDGDIKMNVKTTREAVRDLTTDRWPRERLLDPSYLPVGIGEEDVGADV